MAKFFGGKNPFDDPFFTQPFGVYSPFDDPFFTHTFDNNAGSRKQITIEELNPDDDHDDDAWKKNNMPSKELSVKNSYEFPTGSQSFSFQRVAYGGLDGVYYTSTIGRRTGGDGVTLMEMKEEDRTVGESLHTISKGIHDKGHSVTTKQSSSGKVDSLQTLHNLNEDELVGFEDNWRINADKVLPGWNNSFNLLENTVSSLSKTRNARTRALNNPYAGANKSVWDDFAPWSGWGGWPFPSLEYFGDGGGQLNNESGEPSTRGTSRKVVPIE
ncbi:hypothetical protein BUALT_Bualt19G0017400 [Buddleja alternifolia]|uniref:Uncharacterized protein n=1 Tax=Buddleja alternifolia TaxID=168488 RepID=A0AAV6W8Q1_9LAMI|nr:hypothetical protein BUALT_Bualt19G0017400 [Buddleja alternifolia]